MGVMWSWEAVLESVHRCLMAVCTVCFCTAVLHRFTGAGQFRHPFCRVGAGAQHPGLVNSLYWSAGLDGGRMAYLRVNALQDQQRKHPSKAERHSSRITIADEVNKGMHRTCIGHA